MTDVSSSILAAISTAVAAGAGAVAAFQALETRHLARAKEVVEREDKERPIDPSNLPELNTYLFDTLGGMSVRDYAQDSEARRVVARTIDRVEDFLEEGKARSERPEGRSHIDIAEASIRSGDLVGGLARLRLAVELRLRDLATATGAPSERASPSATVEMLRRAGVLDGRMAGELRYVMNVANRAVHGDPTDPNEAMEAAHIARRLLAELNTQAER